MMIFDPVTAGTLLILAASPGVELCKMEAPTEIEVVPHSEPVEWDDSQSLADLRNIETDTINPYGFDGVSIPEGFMQSSIRLVPEIKLGGKTYPKLGVGCIWYETITINLEIAPVITIASEVADDNCMYEAVKNHEMKHVRALKKLVNKYAASMGKEVYEQLQQRGFSSGPVKEAHMQEIAERMHKTVGQVLELQFKKMEVENSEVQGEVDSLEEYKYVSGLCPDFNRTLKKQAGRHPDHDVEDDEF
jgi:hypothetical protein